MLLDRVGTRIREVLKTENKTKTIVEYLGCTIEEFKAHIESQWVEGMSWASYGNMKGSWQIDHIIPLAFPGADGGPPTIEEVVERLNYQNTQPLWTSDNASKGSRYVGKPNDKKNRAAPAPAT